MKIPPDNHTAIFRQLTSVVAEDYANQHEFREAILDIASNIFFLEGGLVTLLWLQDQSDPLFLSLACNASRCEKKKKVEFKIPAYFRLKKTHEELESDFASESIQSRLLMNYANPDNNNKVESIYNAVTEVYRDEASALREVLLTVENIGIIQILGNGRFYSDSFESIEHLDFLQMLFTLKIKREREVRIEKANEGFIDSVANASHSQDIYQAASVAVLELTPALICNVYKKSGSNWKLTQHNDSRKPNVPIENATECPESDYSLCPRKVSINGTDYAFHSVISHVNGVPKSDASESSRIDVMFETDNEKLRGYFSDTDKAVCARVATLMEYLMPQMKLSEGLDLVGGRIAELQKVEDDLILSDQQTDRHSLYADLIRELVPAIKEVTLEDCSENAYWSQLSESSTIFHKKHFDIYLSESDTEQKLVRCACDSAHLAVFEKVIIKQIAIDIRLMSMQDINLRHAATQLAEIRHALRGGLMAVIQNLKTAHDTFELFRNKDQETAYKKLIQGASYRRHIQRAQLGAATVNALFEESRLLVSRMSRKNLQLTPNNIFELTKEQITVLLYESKRREVPFNLSQRGTRAPSIAMCDRPLVIIAIFNILDNALKYSYQKNPVDVVYSEKSGKWNLEITNTGRHIPNDDREDIFRPFKRADEAAGISYMPGTGLGLWATAKILSLHSEESKIECESNLHDEKSQRATTRFLISMPLSSSNQN